MTLIAPMWWRRGHRAASQSFPPATGDGSSAVVPGAFANAPTSAGWTTVRDMNMSQMPYRLNYEANNGSGMYYYNPDDVARVSLQTTSSDPATPPTSIRTTIPAAWTGGGESMSRWETRNFPANDGNLYLGYTIKPSADWWHPADAGWKNWYLRPAGGDLDSIHFLAWVDTDGDGAGTMLPKAGTQWRGAATDEAWQNGTATYANRLIPGEWNTVEFLITPNSGGLYNGSLSIWINGVSVAITNPDHGTGINWFLAGQTIGWSGVWWDMIYAGTGAAPPAEQYIEHGHVLIKVKQSGSLTGTFPNAPSGGGWTALSEQDPSGLPRRWEAGAYESANGTGTVVYTQDMYNGLGAYNYITYTGGVATPWSSSGSYLSLRFPPSHPGGYTTVKVEADPAGVAPLSFPAASAPTGEVYFAFYIRLRGSAGLPYTSSGNQQKLLYFYSSDSGNTTIHIILGKLPDAGDLSLEPQFNPPGSGLFNNIHRGASAAITDQDWHLVEIRLKRNTYSSGSGNCQVSGDDATFNNSQTGTLAVGSYICVGSQTFRITAGSGFDWTVEPSASSATGSLPFTIPNSDGEFELWLDGARKAVYTNVALYLHPGGDNAVPDLWKLEPIYGGGSAPSPSTHSLYIDYGRIKIMAR
jgi:hypothetical protein